MHLFHLLVVVWCCIVYVHVAMVVTAYIRTFATFYDVSMQDAASNFQFYFHGLSFWRDCGSSSIRNPKKVFVRRIYPTILSMSYKYIWVYTFWTWANLMMCAPRMYTRNQARAQSWVRDMHFFKLGSAGKYQKKIRKKIKKKSKKFSKMR